MNLVRFPEPEIEGAWVLARGYEHWIMPHWAAFWALVLTETRLELEPAPVPPHITDCATEDGDTPRGHPGDSHDGGDDIDRTFAMTENPNGNFIVGSWANNELVGPPVLLAAEYEARILVKAAMLDLEFGGLIQTWACDEKIRAPLEIEVDRFGLDPAVRRRTISLIRSARSHSSWRRWHHHHSHTRHTVEEEDDAIAFTEEWTRRRLVLVAASQRPQEPDPQPLTVLARLDDHERRLAALEAR